MVEALYCSFQVTWQLFTSCTKSGEDVMTQDKKSEHGRNEVIIPSIEEAAILAGVTKEELTVIVDRLRIYHMILTRPGTQQFVQLRVNVMHLLQQLRAAQKDPKLFWTEEEMDDYWPNRAEATVESDDYISPLPDIPRLKNAYYAAEMLADCLEAVLNYGFTGTESFLYLVRKRTNEAFKILGIPFVIPVETDLVSVE